ncbi:hypothetical protein [Actinocrispum sp. NPDC049592]|uniref:hypothetical protein n=1 Tax=Actinocrispum sp. NPDC049592 TaxID=3154835 RepID=UPI00341F6089
MKLWQLESVTRGEPELMMRLDVLSGSKLELYEAADTIRSCRFGPADRVISAVEVYRRFGGGFLEDVLEKGSRPTAWGEP